LKEKTNEKKDKKLAIKKIRTKSGKKIEGKN
jgi:hypothetical protein